MRQIVLLTSFVLCLTSCSFVYAQDAPFHLLVPTGVSVDVVGNVFIADTKDYRVLKQGLVFAGDGSPCANSTSRCGD